MSNEAKSNSIFGNETRHDSFGLIAFGRVTSSKPVALFGSSVKHRETIRVTVQRAVLHRDLNHDFIGSVGPVIVEVEMSPVQFAEFITTPNRGSGIPCTITAVNGQMVEPPTLESKREQFVNEFREHTDRIAEQFGDLQALVEGLTEKPSVSKSERKDIAERIRFLRQQVEANLPFVAKQFNEQMEKTVLEAKGEVEAFITRRIHDAGLTALQAESHVPQLEDQSS
jgi:hypothetical protein